MVSQGKPKTAHWSDLASDPVLRILLSLEVPLSCSDHDGELGDGGKDLDPPDETYEEENFEKFDVLFVSVVKILFLLIVGWNDQGWSGEKKGKCVAPVDNVSDNNSSYNGGQKEHS